MVILKKGKSSEFRFEVGQTIKDDKRDLTITDREYRTHKNNKNWKEKWYKYKCNVCEWTEGWIIEGGIVNGNGCLCCRGLTIVEGINDISTTSPWMIPYVGEEIAKTHTRCSSDKTILTCPDCGRKSNKPMIISGVYNHHGFECSCSDKVSYPEKVMFALLMELKSNFIHHRKFEWSSNKEYDFIVYLSKNNEEILIETNGLQHYKETNRGKSLNEEIANDNLKKKLALYNGIKEDNYIVIDCRRSDFEFIKQNILKSNLTKIFCLNNINWLKVEKKSLSNVIKEVCDIKNKNIYLSTIDIGKIANLDSQLVRNYLIKGSKFGWCEYNGKIELAISKLNQGKTLICIETEQLFESSMECSRKSLDMFGVKINNCSIGRVCNGIQFKVNGFTFKYIKNLTREEYIKYSVKNKLNNLIKKRGDLYVRY